MGESLFELTGWGVCTQPPSYLHYNRSSSWVLAQPLLWQPLGSSHPIAYSWDAPLHSLPTLCSFFMAWPVAEEQPRLGPDSDL